MVPVKVRCGARALLNISAKFFWANVEGFACDRRLGIPRGSRGVAARPAAGMIRWRTVSPNGVDVS